MIHAFLESYSSAKLTVQLPNKMTHGHVLLSGETNTEEIYCTLCSLAEEIGWFVFVELPLGIESTSLSDLSVFSCT